MKVEVMGPSTVVPARLIVATATANDVIDTRAITVGPSGWTGTYVTSPLGHFLTQLFSVFSVIGESES